MPTLYVAKNGNDANAGTSYGVAKLTIQGAVNAANAGDTILIGAGVYYESVSGTVNNLTFKGDGYVVMENNVAFTSAIIHAGGADSYVYVENLVFVGYLGNAVLNSSYNGTVSALYCEFISCTTGLGIPGGSNSQYVGVRCLFLQCTTGAYGDGSVSYCTFAACTTGCNGMGGAHNCLFYKCGRDLIDTSAVDYNVHYAPTIAVGRLGSTDYVTLANWQANGPGYDPNSIDTDPVINDEAQEDYGFGPASPAATASETGKYVGCMPPTWARSQNHDPEVKWSIDAGGLESGAGSGWVATPGASFALGGDGTLQYITTGAATLTSPVFDGTVPQTVLRIDLGAVETYPASVFDYNIDDAGPNRKKIEYRTQATSFNQDDAVLAWQTAEIVSGRYTTTLAFQRYFQFRLTARDDGVAA